MDIDQTVRAAWNETAPHDQWIVEIADDYVIVTDEKDRSFHRVPVLVGDDVTFGAPVKVTPGYVDVAAAAPVHRVVFASRAESRPEVAAATATVLDPEPAAPPDPRPPAEPARPAAPPPPEEPPTPPDTGGVAVSPGAEPDRSEPKEDPVSLSDELRSRLGLAADADEAAALAAIDALKSKADIPAPDPEQVAASAAAVKENDELRREVKVLASQVETMSTKVAAAEAEKQAAVKASVIQKAVDEGRIAPADREQWEKDYDEAPGAIARTLNRIAAGAAVPVQASGYTGGGDEAGLDDEYEALTRTLDGPYAATTKKEAA